ncbi:hypothetical protein CLV78_101954 [Aliiruegeria haliotis]|uniref:Uncharacterized protein n=1 Tax=Aliiruegeria haliotis TaxID=1280846 RepID=A0A2T0S0C2_9RHOB|nr:hypothetical protein CLV78_101954 [Aliiruegeria haliotis]
MSMTVIAALICGACLTYLVISRTLKKRRKEEADSAQ